MLMNYLVVLQGLMVVRSMSNTNRSSFALSIEKTPLPSPSLFLSRIRTRHHHCHSTLLLQRLFHGHPQRVSHRDGTSSSNATISPMIQHANTSVDHLRRRRHASRERVIDDGENANVYGDDDGKRLRLQPEEIAEHRRDFKGEDDLPLARRFNSKDELYDDDDIDHARSDLREPDRRLMQNNEESDRFFADTDRQYSPRNPYEQDLSDYDRMLEAQRARHAHKNVKNLDNDYLDRPDS